MKRLFSLFLLFSLLLTGCGLPDSDPTVITTAATEPPLPTEAPDPYADQLRLIWREMDSWIQDPYADAWCYAVTDLDGNGRLEFLSSDTQGTGRFVTTRMWEVSGDGTTLVPIENSNEYGSGIVLTSGYQSDGSETVPCFYDSGTGTYSYIQRVTTSISATESMEVTSAVSFAKGTLRRTILGSKTITHNPDSVSYEDADGNPITEAEYVAIAETYFAGCPTTNAHIRWLDCVSISDLAKDMLQTSWKGFSQS